jgi:uncharacterized protein (DUF2164 family)
MKKIVLTKEAEQGALLSLREYFQREREETLSDFQAKFILDFFLADIGPYVYNQAVADAHALMSERIEELFALEKVPEHKDKGALQPLKIRVDSGKRIFWKKF